MRIGQMHEKVVIAVLLILTGCGKTVPPANEASQVAVKPTASATISSPQASTPTALPQAPVRKSQPALPLKPETTLPVVQSNPTPAAKVPATVPTPTRKPAEPPVQPVVKAQNPQKSLAQEQEDLRSEVGEKIRALVGASCQIGREMELYEAVAKRWAEVGPLLTRLENAGIRTIELKCDVTDDMLKTLLRFHDLEELTARDLSAVTDEAISLLKQQTKLKKLTLRKGTRLTPKGTRALSALTNLEWLSLADVNLGEPLPLAENCPNLISIDLEKCSLTDQSLANLDRYKKLLFVRLAGNPKITDAGLKHIAKLTGLRQLDLAGSSVTGFGLAQLTGLKNLTDLGLQDTAITDDALEHVGAMPGLESLDLWGCKITDAGFRHLRGKNLHVRIAENSRFDGTGFQYLAKSRLGLLELGTTAITDAGLEQIKRLEGIEQLELPRYGDPLHDSPFWNELHAERITDAGLRHVGAMTSVKKLYISGGGITDAGLVHLANMQKLTQLEFGACPGIRGPGLATLAKLPQLEFLDLGNTHVGDESLNLLLTSPKLNFIVVGPDVSKAAAEGFQKARANTQVIRHPEFCATGMKTRHKK